MDTPTGLNNVVLCFIVPPPEDRPHSSWRAVVYTKEIPEKIFYKNRTLPTKIVPHAEIMKQEICDPDHIPAHIVQLSDQAQYVYLEGDVCEIIGVEINFADGVEDPYLKRCQQVNLPPVQPKSSLIVPGQVQPSGAPLIVGIHQPMTIPQMQNPNDLKDVYVLDITFKTHGVKDQDTVDLVKSVAWNHGLTL